MRMIVAILTLLVAAAFGMPALAGKITTKSACEAAGGTWNDSTNKCSKRHSGY